MDKKIKMEDSINEIIKRHINSIDDSELVENNNFKKSGKNYSIVHKLITGDNYQQLLNLVGEQKMLKLLETNVILQKINGYYVQVCGKTLASYFQR